MNPWTALVYGLTSVKVAVLVLFTPFFVKKVSASKAIDSASLVQSVLSADTFFILSLLSIPFALIGFSGLISLGLVNITASTVFHRNLIKQYPPRTSSASVVAALTLILVGPSSFYFSMVALRDYLAAVFVVILLLRIFEQRVKRQLISSAVILSALISLRPEMLIYVLAVFFAHAILVAELRLRQKLLTFILLFLVCPLAVSWALSVSFHLTLTDLLDLKSILIEPRYERQFLSDGGESAIMSARDFQATPLPALVLKQLLATVLIPGLDYSSWSGQQYVAFLDSGIFLLAILWLFYLWLFHNRKYAAFGLLAAGLYLLSIAPLMVNYGNAFRMRLPAVMIVLVFAYASAVTRRT